MRLVAIARALSSAFIDSTALGKAHEDSDCTYGCDHCRSLKLTCRNSPCWRSCERCTNFLSSLWPPLLTRSTDGHDHHVTCELIEYFTCTTGELQPVATAATMQECSCPLNTIEVKSFLASIQTTVNVLIVWQLGTRDKLQKKHRSCIELKFVPYSEVNQYPGFEKNVVS